MFNAHSTKTLQGTSIQQMWEILRAHELRINSIAEFLDSEVETPDVEKTDVEKHVSGLKDGGKIGNVKRGRGGKNVTLNVTGEN